MIIFVAHEYGGWPLNIDKAKSVVRYLQKGDPENCYICPLIALSYLEYREISYEDEMNLCLDMLSISDKLLVVGRITEGVQQEIDFAKLVKMPISYYSWHPERMNPIQFLHF